MKLNHDEFDRCVAEAIEAIDPQFRIYLEEVPVVVEDLPDDAVTRKMHQTDRRSLLGLFRGVPLNRRSVWGSDGPNQIVLYRRNLMSACRNRQQLEEQIRRTLIHELAHYVGFSEEQIRQLDY